jgi:hypothetical protein
VERRLREVKDKIQACDSRPKKRARKGESINERELSPTAFIDVLDIIDDNDIDELLGPIDGRALINNAKINDGKDAETTMCFEGGFEELQDLQELGDLKQLERLQHEEEVTKSCRQCFFKK